MTKTKQNNQKDIIKLLQGFEYLANNPVIVSLLVKDGKIYFSSCSEASGVPPLEYEALNTTDYIG